MMTSAPALAKSSMYCAGLVIIRWASSGSRVQRRTASTTIGPIVMLGTKWPSMTSIWMRCAPAASASRTCSPRRVKSADRIDGTILIIDSAPFSRFYMYLLRNRTVYHPCDLTFGRAHDLRGIFVGVVFSLDDGVQGIRFVSACCQEEYVAGGVQNGRGESQAIDRKS